MSDGSIYIFLGLVIALVYDLFATENPAKIPLRLVARRGALGVVLYLVFWFLVTWCFVGRYVADHPAVAILMGIVFPQLARLKDGLVNFEFAKRFPKLVGALQVIDDLTRKYLQGEVDREERRAVFQALEQDSTSSGTPVDRLYECYLIDIARQQVNKHPSQQVYQLRHVKSRVVKCRLVLWLLGYDDFFATLSRVIADPRCVLPSWPVEEGNRRKGGDRRRKRQAHEPERRQSRFGRRQLDNPRVIDVLLSANDDPHS
jgi:hypothetical protein